MTCVQIQEVHCSLNVFILNINLKEVWQMLTKTLKSIILVFKCIYVEHFLQDLGL